MISERMEEQASLYVLGAMNEAERREFASVLANDRELQELVARLSAVTTAISGTVPVVEPPPQLRSRILAQAAPQQKMVSLPARKSRWAVNLLGALATGFAAVALILAIHQVQLSDTIKQQAGQIADLHQLADSLQSATNDLRHEVLALQETNRLATLRIAMLNSVVADSPKTVAVSLWDNQKQSGVFVAENLKALPSDQDYELWVIDEEQKPVAAGIIRVDENGKVRMDFQPARLVKTAGMFAVTKEAKGGAASPTLKNMVLAGN